MIKKIIVSLGLLISLVSNAQEGTSSPYSFYGIGDVKFKGTVETRSMGGVSVFSDSIHVNLQNPAQLASLKLTTFSIGATSVNTKLNTEAQNEKARRTNLDYLAVGIPAGKLGFTFGLMPYSSVGYKINKNIKDDEGNIIEGTQYTGLGGINKVFLGMGYKVTKDLSFGIDVQYNFGTIETNSYRYLMNVENGTQEINLSRIQGLNLTTGLAYERKVNKKYTYFGSLVFAPQANLNIKNERTIIVNDQVDNQSVQDLSFNLPSRLSIGSGFGEVRKWLVGAEVTLQSNSDLKNRFDDISGVVFENSTRYSVGGYFIPNYGSFTSYFKRITYRGGLRYENTGLIIKNKSIEDFAVSLGLGLPMSGTFSNLNIGFEIGKRGTKYYNLIEENYVNLSIGLSFSDRWFVKRKYN
jgi:long-subunit fatty acid transport protein